MKMHDAPSCIKFARRKSNFLKRKGNHQSVSQFSCSVMSDCLWPGGLRHARLACPPPTPGAYSNSCPSSPWCQPTLSSSVVPFSSRLQSFPASGSFPMSQSLTLSIVFLSIYHEAMGLFFGRTEAEAETPILWPPHAKSWLTGKDPDAGRDWGQEEKGTTEEERAGWHHQLDGHEFE